MEAGQLPSLVFHMGGGTFAFSWGWGVGGLVNGDSNMKAARIRGSSIDNPSPLLHELSRFARGPASPFRNALHAAQMV